MSQHLECNHCGQLTQIDACFECNKKLCIDCRRSHFNEWRAKAVHNSMNAERNLVDYLEKLESLEPLFSKNSQKLLQAHESIKKNYEIQLKRLNDEKASLDKAIDELINENNKIEKLKGSVQNAYSSLQALRNPSDQFDPVLARNLRNTYEKNVDAIEKINKEFSSFKSSSIQVLDNFEESPLVNHPSNKLIGKLASSDQSIGSYKPPIDFVRPTPRAEARSMLGSAVPSNQSATNITTLSKWKELLYTGAKPVKEMFIDSAPLQFCSFRNHMFVSTKDKRILIYETSTADYLNLLQEFKHDVPDVAALAVNIQYVAVSYCCLDKDKIKVDGTKLRPCGILLYERDLATMSIKKSFHKVILPPQNVEFMKPKGLAMNEKYLFVCDFELRKVLKYELLGGVLVHQINFGSTEQPYKISVNAQYAVVTEMKNHTVNLYDAGNFELKGKKSIQGDGSHGPFDVAITSDNMILIKNYLTSTIKLLDLKLDTHCSFDLNRTLYMTSFCLIELQPKPILSIGCYDNRYFKIACYSY